MLINKETHKCIISFFRSQHCLEKLQAHNAPDEIINSEKVIQQSLINKAKEFNFNVYDYWSSVPGQIAYLQYCAEENHDQAINDRCKQCQHETYYDDWQMPPCSLHTDESRPMNCSDFSKASKDFVDRMWDAFEQCATCVHNKVDVLPGSIGLEHTSCVKKQDKFHCTIKQEK